MSEVGKNWPTRVFIRKVELTLYEMTLYKMTSYEMSSYEMSTVKMISFEMTGSKKFWTFRKKSFLKSRGPKKKFPEPVTKP